MTRIPRGDLETLAIGIIEEFGTPSTTAGVVAESLVEADLRGYGTHGVGILPLYAEMVADGAIDPTAEPTVVSEDGSTVLVDGERGFGQLTGALLAELGQIKAERAGGVVVGFRNASHVGRTGEWARRAAADGKILLAFTNSGGGAQNTAPPGSHERKLVPNTIAAGIPTFGRLPFEIVVDFATSQVAGSTIRRYHRRGASLHEEWTTSEGGEPLTDPADFVAGEGALLPLGGRTTGHKGYGLVIVAELLAGLVGGERIVGEANPTWFANGGTVVVIDPTAFVSRDRLEARIDAISDHLRDDDVRLPGEGSHERRNRALRDGVETRPHDLVTVASLAEDLGIDVPETVREAIADVDVPSDEVRTW